MESLTSKRRSLAGSRWTTSRRGFLRSALAGAVSVAAFGAALPRRAAAQSTLSPDAALRELLEGNARFAQKRLSSFKEDLEILRQNTVAKQEPFAAVLSCADSRVPVELVFDQSIGHIFVTRNAGNIATPEIIASLEYGAGVLGTKAILVLGHAGCGALKAAISGKAVPGQISALFAALRPAVDASGGDLDAPTAHPLAPPRAGVAPAPRPDGDAAERFEGRGAAVRTSHGVALIRHGMPLCGKAPTSGCSLRTK